MAIATKTINPLHFEDLDPHRFEDLVRQLAYNFREWTALEATGRQGSDDGFDARGWEAVSPVLRETSDDGTGEAEELIVTEDRIWLIQCKREKAIASKKLITYLDAIAAGAPPLYGLVFVAACDFSKKTRDKYRKWCTEKGIKEFFLWGKAELEDMLFQPKNDHLLFGYFGISLQIKKRSVKTALRAMLTTKRQAIRHLGPIDYADENFSDKQVLLRDPETESYPYSDEIENFNERPLWRIYDYIGHYHAGIEILIANYFAYLDDDGVKWDFEERVRTNVYHNNPWPIKSKVELEKVRNYWYQLPEKNRAELKIIGYIPYEDIMLIDENGDPIFPHPHIYVRHDSEWGPFSMTSENLVSGPIHRRIRIEVEEKNRIKYFPNTYPDIKKKLLSTLLSDDSTDDD